MDHHAADDAALARFHDETAQVLGPERASALTGELGGLLANASHIGALADFRRRLAEEVGFETANNLIGLPKLNSLSHEPNKWEKFFLDQVAAHYPLNDELRSLLLTPVSVLKAQSKQLALLTMFFGVPVATLDEDVKAVLYTAYAHFTEGGKNRKAESIWREHCHGIILESQARGLASINFLAYAVYEWTGEMDAARKGGCLSTSALLVSLLVVVSVLARQW